MESRGVRSVVARDVVEMGSLRLWQEQEVESRRRCSGLSSAGGRRWMPCGTGSGIHRPSSGRHSGAGKGVT